MCKFPRSLWIVLGLAVSGPAFAAPLAQADIAPLWTALTPFPSFAEPTSIVLRPDGRSIVAGHAESPNGAEALTVVAYTADGLFEWSDRNQGLGYFGGRPTVRLDGSGAVYLSGSAVLGEPGSSPDVSVHKFAADGTPAWTQYYNGPASRDDYVASMAVSPSGLTYVTGSSVANEYNYDMTTWMYTADGTPQWVRRFAGPNCPQTNRRSWGLDVCLVGTNAVVAGTAYDGTSTPEVACGSQLVLIRYLPNGTTMWMNFHPDFIPVKVASSSTAIYVLSDQSLLKFDAALGTLLWAAPLRADSHRSVLWLQTLAVDPNGEPVVAGMQFNPTADGNYSSSQAILALDASGNERWRSTPFSGPGLENLCRSLAIASDGSIYGTGDREGNVATIALSSSGDVLWETEYDGGLADRGTAIAVDLTGVYVAARVGQSVGDAFAVLKYALSAPLAVEPPASSSPLELRLSLVPGSSTLDASFDLNRAQTVRLEVYDVGGRRLSTSPAHFTSAGRHSMRVDLHEAAHGMVFARLRTESGAAARKAVLLR